MYFTLLFRKVSQVTTDAEHFKTRIKKVQYKKVKQETFKQRRVQFEENKQKHHPSQQPHDDATQVKQHEFFPVIGKPQSNQPVRKQAGQQKKREDVEKVRVEPGVNA